MTVCVWWLESAPRITQCLPVPGQMCADPGAGGLLGSSACETFSRPERPLHTSFSLRLLMCNAWAEAEVAAEQVLQFLMKVRHHLLLFFDNRLPLHCIAERVWMIYQGCKKRR